MTPSQAETALICDTQAFDVVSGAIEKLSDHMDQWSGYFRQNPEEADLNRQAHALLINLQTTLMARVRVASERMAQRVTAEEQEEAA